MTDVMCQPLADYASSHGAEIRTGTAVTEVTTSAGRVGTVTTDAGDIPADNVVLAASLGGAQKLVRAQWGNHEFFAPMLRLNSTPSVCFQIELDEPSLSTDHATFAPGTALASFAEQSRTTYRELDGRLSIIMARPRELLDTSPEQLLELVVTDLNRVGVDLENHVVQYRKVVVEDDFYSLATHQAHLRPTQHTPIPGLALAGDYTRQRYLATMEGAVVSGKRAAATLTET